MKTFITVVLLFLSVQTLAAPSAEYVRQNSVEVTSGTLSTSVVSAIEKYRVIAIGEHHGNDKSPLIAAKLAEALAEGNEVILALEIQQQNQFGLDEYLRTGDKQILRLLGHFAREYQDGRSSLAMVELLDRVRLNSRIQVFAFDPDFAMNGQDRDTKMAQNLIKAIEKHPQKRVVILAGNVHSATKIGNFFDPNYRPMAFQLSALTKSPIKSTDVLSIMTRYESANIWACTNDNAADCGPMKLKKDTSAYSTAVSFESYFLVEPILSPEGYLATWYTRTVDVSLPFR
jgi:hypothetical protein